MHHFFDTDVATQYGVDQAILISHFQYWITHNAANKKNFYEGRYWTYNSYKALSLIFPYYSEKQIRRILGALLDSGVLLAGNFNVKEYDCTKWYSFSDSEKWLAKMPIPSGAQMGRGADMGTTITGAQTGTTMPKQAGRGAQTGKPIPNTVKQIDNTDTNPAIKNKKDVPGEKPDTPAKKVAKEKFKVPGLYQKMLDTYFEWHKDSVGSDPVMNELQGKAMKELNEYFFIQAKRKNSEQAKEGYEVDTSESALVEIANNTWIMLLNAIHKDSTMVEEFYKNQVKLNQIYSNLPNIINQLKNGNPKNKSKQQPAGISEIERELRMETGNAGC